jgi:hypothetical protein
VTPKEPARKEVMTLLAVQPNPLSDSVQYKNHKSFLIDGILYHSSGDKYELASLKKIGEIGNVQIFESENGYQLYISETCIEISGPKYWENLVREDKKEVYERGKTDSSGKPSESKNK